MLLGFMQSQLLHYITCQLWSGGAHMQFISYTEDVTPVFERHKILHHLFAVDKQAYANTSQQGVNDVRGRLYDCITYATGVPAVDSS